MAKLLWYSYHCLVGILVSKKQEKMNKKQNQRPSQIICYLTALKWMQYFLKKGSRKGYSSRCYSAAGAREKQKPGALAPLSCFCFQKMSTRPVTGVFKWIRERTGSVLTLQPKNTTMWKTDTCNHFFMPTLFRWGSAVLPNKMNPEVFTRKWQFRAGS